MSTTVENYLRELTSEILKQTNNICSVCYSEDLDENDYGRCQCTLVLCQNCYDRCDFCPLCKNDFGKEKDSEYSEYDYDNDDDSDFNPEHEDEDEDEPDDISYLQRCAFIQNINNQINTYLEQHATQFSNLNIESLNLDELIVIHEYYKQIADSFEQNIWDQINDFQFTDGFLDISRIRLNKIHQHEEDILNVLKGRVEQRCCQLFSNYIFEELDALEYQVLQSAWEQDEIYQSHKKFLEQYNKEWFSSLSGRVFYTVRYKFDIATVMQF